MAGTAALQTLAILLYPGIVLAGAAGLLVETVLTRKPRQVLRGLARPGAAMIAAAGLAGLACAQVAAPFSLADPGDRNLLVAVIALAAAACLGWAAGGGRGGPLLTAGLAAAGLALLTPAVFAQDLHPQVVGAGGPEASAIRAGAALLYVLGLGLLLPALAGSPLRLWLWAPAGALFASVFLPPFSGDPLGLAEFLGVTAVVIGAGALISRFGSLFL